MRVPLNTGDLKPRNLAGDIPPVRPGMPGRSRELPSVRPDTLVKETPKPVIRSGDLPKSGA